MFRRFLNALAALVLFPALLLAQAAPVDTGERCLALGAIIGVAVAILKRLPFGVGRWIGKNPKLIATILSSVAALAPLIKGSGASIAEIAACVAAYVAG